MGTDASFAEYVCDQLGPGPISSRKMFGEYAIYYGEKVVALVCDNRLFVRPTAGGRAHLEQVVEAPPYPGAKPHFLIADLLDDSERLAELIRITASELPMPKPKKPRAKAVRPTA